MPLDVEPPEPPSLEDQIDPNEYEDATVVGETDYKREEIAAFLREGAWEEAFADWAARTDMEPRTFAIVADLELIARFDFFWDSFAERVGYHAPGIPEDWKERNFHPELDSWSRVSSINAGLTEFGQTVCDVLADRYIDWEAEFEAPDDLPDF